MQAKLFKRLVHAGITAFFAAAVLALPCHAEQADMATRRSLYECQKRAAEYLYNLDKAGDQERFERHVQQCLELSRATRSQADPVTPDLPKPATLLAGPATITLEPNPSGEAVDLEIKDSTTYIVSKPGLYNYRYINIHSGGILKFEDGLDRVDFWAKSILVENRGTLQAGTQETPIARRTITFHLYGADTDTDAITCKTTVKDKAECDVPLSTWDNHTTPIALPGMAAGQTDYFYGYYYADPQATKNRKLITDEVVTTDTAYFGRKVIAVAYGGTLRMFGAKGVDPKAADSSSGKSWTRLDGSIKSKEKEIKLSSDVDWDKGDLIVISSSDYLPGHAEQFVINQKDNRTITLDTPALFPHNGTSYDLTQHAIPERITKKTSAETRAAVALLSRNIRVVSAGSKPGESLPPENSPDTNRYFGGHMIVRQGFKQFQMQGVELYQMGQGGRMAHTPVNFFLTRKVPDQTFVKDCSIWDSMNHWIELRGTQGVVLQRNVGYKSIGHGFVLADGTEVENRIQANIGIYARPGADYRDNPRKVPGVLAQRTLQVAVKDGNFSGGPDTLANTSLALGGDLFHPSPFFIMNAYNTINDNMASGAGACGSCYWFAPAVTSGFSIGKTWVGMAGIQNQQSGGAAPIKSFKGNFCSTAMYSLLTLGDVGLCKGFAQDPMAAGDAVIPPLKNPFAGLYTKSCLDTYKQGINGLPPDKQLTDEYCPVDQDGDNRLTPIIKTGADTKSSLDPEQECTTTQTDSCGVNVIDSYTSSFHWAQTNFSAIWLRTFWYLFTDSFVSDVMNGGLTMVSGGSYNQVPVGYWGLTRRSVFAGETHPDTDFSKRSGPRTAGTGLSCAGPGAYCLLKNGDQYEGISFPTDNFGTYQRLVNIYDGPVYLDSVAFVDIHKTDLTNTDCKAPTKKAEKSYGHVDNRDAYCKQGNNMTEQTACFCPAADANDTRCYGANNCKGTGLIYDDNRGYPVIVDKDHPGYIPFGSPGFATNTNRCILPNAAIGWKQPNGFYYPPAFHMKNLHFSKVDIRHFVLVPPFVPGTMQTDMTRLSTEYCGYSPGLYESFTDIDRQTQINDDDGSLSGVFYNPNNTTVQSNLRFTGSISLNNDTFYHTPNRMFESLSQQSCLQTPYDHLNLAIIPANTTPDDALPNWAKECQDKSCTGALIYRQYRLNNTEGDDAFGDKQGIRMMGAGIAQRSVMLANNGLYYLDTALREQTANRTYFEGGKTYNFFLLYAKPTTKVSFQLYVGSGFREKGGNVSIAKIHVDTKKIAGHQQINDAVTVNGNWPLADAAYDIATGILTVTLNLKDSCSGVPQDNSICKAFQDATRESCQPASFCSWDDQKKSCGLTICKWDKSQNSCLPAAHCITDKANKSCTTIGYKETDATICSDWAVKTPECPSGGCYGFQISFPTGFEDDLKKHAATEAARKALRPKGDLYSNQSDTWPELPFTLNQGGVEAGFVYYSEDGKRLDLKFETRDKQLQATIGFNNNRYELKQESDSGFSDDNLKLKLDRDRATLSGALTFNGTLFKP